MNLLFLSWQNLRARPLSTFMSLLLLTMGVSIISLLLLLNQQLSQHFNRNIKGIDLVVGAKGSPLQLILASVYHIDNPTGNIPLAEANRLASHPLVKSAIRMAYGDSYQGYRILGTESSYPAHYQATLTAGRMWDAPFEVTLGASVAQRLGLQIGDEFFGQHGSDQNAETHAEHGYRVVGIFAPNGSVIDQLIMTPMASVWGVHDHAEEAPASGPAPVEAPADHDEEAGHSENDHDEDHHEDDHAEGEAYAHATDSLAEEGHDITAMLITYRSPMGMMVLPRMINQQTSMQAALPAIEINRLFELFAVGIDTLRAIALAIIVISGISVFVSLYNSLRERRYELALMRSMGASRGQLCWLVVQEGLILATLGYVLGMALSRAGMWLLSSALLDDFHYQFSNQLFLAEEGYLLLVTWLIGLLAAAIPATQAFYLNISETLADG
jgi:putative ABC transport system permease protein